MPDYCPSCGTRLQGREVENRVRSWCDRCREVVYRNPKPTAGVLVQRENQVLLVKRKFEPAAGKWSVPAGYQEVDETPRETAVRELNEETGLEVTASSMELFDVHFVRYGADTVDVILYSVSRSETQGELNPGTDAAAVKFWSDSSIDSSQDQIESTYERVLINFLEQKGK